jgi:nicotinate dehydrogenase subunit A
VALLQPGLTVTSVTVHREPVPLPAGAVPQEFVLTVNGRTSSVTCGPDTPLLYVLRNDLGLVGARFGCGQGLCGACTVLLAGQVVHSCDTPIRAVGDQPVTTVEALGTTERPGPLQRAFLAHGAGQCGFCLSGILVTATALLQTKPDVDEADVREALDGNLCRCGAHNRIVAAVLAARDEHRGAGAGSGPGEEQP